MIHPISTEWLTLRTLAEGLRTRQHVQLSPEARLRIEQGRAFLDQKLADHQATWYGINTGFGDLCYTRIETDQLETLQSNLVLSHACGIGQPVPDEVVRLMLWLKIQSLAYGHSGIRLETVQRLVDFYNADVLPVVLEKGSLGASGDLVPLAHLSLPLMGLGEVRINGERVPTQALEARFGWKPLRLAAKEGLALLNGTQFMAALLAHALIQARQLSAQADALGALSMEAFDCRMEPLHPAIHRVRQQGGQVRSAAALRTWLEGSALAQQPKTQVQDPYSFRCIPQVHGASQDSIAYVQQVLEQEINAVTDNPLLFPEEDLIVSGGNFHGQPLALVADFLALALAELGNISERRTYLLLSGKRGLPAFLAQDPGLNSGLMIPQYAAASLVSQNKQLASPASVDSITSSNGQEDHVSMGANAALRLLPMAENLRQILAIELLTAAQALHFRGVEKTSPALQKLVADYRQQVPLQLADRFLSPEIGASAQFLRTWEARWDV